MTLTKQIQNLTLSESNTVLIHKILPITTKADQEREETLALLKRCVPQVGMYLGEEIEAAVARMEGARFSSVDYHFERLTDSQKI